MGWDKLGVLGRAGMVDALALVENPRQSITRTGISRLGEGWVAGIFMYPR